MEGESQAWLIIPDKEYPYGQEVLRTLTPEGIEIWYLVDQIRSCHDPAWSHDADALAGSED